MIFTRLNNYSIDRWHVSLGRDKFVLCAWLATNSTWTSRAPRGANMLLFRKAVWKFNHVMTKIVSIGVSIAVVMKIETFFMRSKIPHIFHVKSANKVPVVWPFRYRRLSQDFFILRTSHCTELAKYIILTFRDVECNAIPAPFPWVVIRPQSGPNEGWSADPSINNRG